MYLTVILIFRIELVFSMLLLLGKWRMTVFNIQTVAALASNPSASCGKERGLDPCVSGAIAGLFLATPGMHLIGRKVKYTDSEDTLYAW